MAILAIVLALWLFVLALVKPRLLTYAIFALSPTQFIFIPVSNFFLSPADVLIVAAGAAFVFRLAAGDRRSASALWQHRYLVLMVGAYLLGFAVLSIFTRTIVRLVMSILVSVLACETLRRTEHVGRAAAALVLAALVDGLYGLVFYAIGQPLYPGRFSGMSGVNFSAAVILTAAAIVLARSAHARRWVTLARPGALIALGAATLSQMGALGFATSWIVVLRRVVSRRNTGRLALAGVAVIIVALASSSVRATLVNRNTRQLEADGVERNSVDVRWNILRTAWKGIEANPIVGVGFAGFQAYSTIDPDIAASTAGVGYGTHNTYIEVIVEGGILAFLFLLAHFWQYVRPLVSVLRDVDSRQDMVLASALVGFPLVLVAAALSNVLIDYHFWCVCGLAMAGLRLPGRRVSLQQHAQAGAAHDV